MRRCEKVGGGFEPLRGYMQEGEGGAARSAIGIDRWGEPVALESLCPDSKSVSE